MPNKSTGKPDSEAKKQWMKENAKYYGVKVMKRTEPDIIEYLEGKSAATEFKRGIRLLIEMEKANAEKGE